MEFEDFGKPVNTGRAGRIILGVIFLAFAAFAAFAVDIALRQEGLKHPGFLGFLITLAIIVGYVGYRLVKMSDGENLLGWRASLLGGVVLIAVGVYAGGSPLLRGTALEDMTNGLLISFFSVAGGWWLIRSTIRRTDEP